LNSYIVRKIFLLFLISFLALAAVTTASGLMLSRTSTNWAGYAINSIGITAISASWSVPEIQCTVTGATNTVTQGVGVWVGIDGLGTAIPEQVGTISQCFNGSPEYYTFEEDPSISSGSTNHALVAIPETSGGDHIAASIAYLGNDEFQLTIKDATSDESRTYTVIIHNAARASAEWIVEAFQMLNTGKQVTLPTFQPITFSDCTASINNLAGSILQDNAESITMTDGNGNPIASPQGLNQSGTSFQVAEVG